MRHLLLFHHCDLSPEHQLYQFPKFQVLLHWPRLLGQYWFAIAVNSPLGDEAEAPEDPVISLEVDPVYHS
ncbi:hypothetical protein CEXT_736261 [Caerostris extrusa]|uniref:Uncharacterized protein n=1 Tax=Caerostris extrusa TaxID=172846 RepID=A0AAV4M8D0_CAEEX|nr:hypothetical protein CEXT_736261 [Caerostris extrusa]